MMKKFFSETSQSRSEEGEGAGHNFSEVEKATSENWKKLLLRSRKTASKLCLFRMKKDTPTPTFLK